jgi:hypothetical protein
VEKQSEKDAILEDVLLEDARKELGAHVVDLSILDPARRRGNSFDVRGNGSESL